MKLAAEKNLNKFAFPVFSIKGRQTTYPLKIEMGSFGFLCEKGIFGPKNWMIMDILGTYIIHRFFNKRDGKVEFQHKIPTQNDPKTKGMSSAFVSYRLLKYVTSKFSAAHQGIIPASFYSDEGHLQEIDPLHKRIKKAVEIKVTDAYLKQEVPILNQYSSRQIFEMIKQTGEFVVRMNYPIRFFDGKNYQNFPFNNYKFPCSFFRLLNVQDSKISKDGHILEREYIQESNRSLCVLGLSI